MGRPRSPYWLRFVALAAGSFALLLLFIFAFLPQRFVLHAGFNESAFSFPAIGPVLPDPPVPSRAAEGRPVPRGPAERLWDEYRYLNRTGAHGQAADLLRRYLARHPNDLGVRVEYARRLWSLGRLAEAESMYRAALDHGAGPEIRRELARLRVLQRQWDAALTDYESLLQAAPADTALLREYAETATRAERYALAGSLYERLGRLAPENAGLRVIRARLLYWAGEPERARELLIGIPDGLAGVDTLRKLLSRTQPERPEAGPTPTEQVIPVDPLGRARELMLADSLTEAVALFRRYLTEHAGADSVRLELAGVLEYRIGATDSAIVELRRYLEKVPDDAGVRLRLARNLAWSARGAEARAVLEDLLAGEAPDSIRAAAWALRGDLDRWGGEFDGAGAAYERALALDAESEEARAGRASLTDQVETMLARRGRIGPESGTEYFGDSDDFRRLVLRAGWSTGRPRTRLGLQGAGETLSGRRPGGDGGDLIVGELAIRLERWWREGEVRAVGSLGLWAGERSVEPVISLELLAPDWHDASYALEYGHGPAYRETATLEAALMDLRIDRVSGRHYRRLSGRWDLQADVGVAAISGLGQANRRLEGGLGLMYRSGTAWTFGYETRWLGYADPAPRAPRRLYWDPASLWSHSAWIRWAGTPASGWQIGLQATPGVAWVDERVDEGVAALFSAGVDARRRWGVWSVEGRAGFSQSRAGEYRAFRLQLGVSRVFRP